jgi:hemolysin activation/secretion protein
MNLLFKITFTILISIITLNANDKDAAKKQAESNALKNQLDQNIDLQKRDLESIKEFKGGVAIPEKNFKELVLSDEEQNNCYEFKEIIVLGNTVISNAELAKITSKYLNKCITISIAQEYMLEEIVLKYQKKGYILAIPYFPEQNIKQGTLQVIIKEGILEDIDFDEEEINKSAVKWAFLGTIGKPINMRYLEQALEILNYSGAYQATMDLKPGYEPGSSILVLKATRVSNKYHGSIGVSNDYNTLARKPFPKKELRTTMSINSGDFILPNDIWNINASYTFKENTDAKSGSIGFSYTLPLGYWEFSLNNNTDMYNNKIRTTYSNYVNEGLSASNSFEAKRVISRAQSYILKGFFKPNYYFTDSYFDGLWLASSSYELYYFDFGLEYQYFSQYFSTTTVFTYTHGEPIMGLKKQYRETIQTPFGLESLSQNLFDIWKISNNTSIPIFTRLSYANRISAQYTKDTLYAINDFNVISGQGVRGYEGIYSNYGSGFFMQNDLTYDVFVFENKWIRKISMLLGLDMGGSLDEITFEILNDKGRPFFAWYSEIKTQGIFSFSLGYGKPIAPIKYMPKNHEVVKISFNISI